MKPSNKKKMTAILSAVLVLAIAVGATLAYLATLTKEVYNAFSFAENIKARLDEPNWKPGDGDDLIPGVLVRKDPIVTNVSDNGIDEFVAIRVNFTDGNEDMLSDTSTDTDYVGRLLRLLDITWNTDYWELMDEEYEDAAEQIWIYKGTLAPGQPTPPLFDSVTIKSQFTAAELQADPTLDWDEEFAWLASVVMTHDDSCYEYGECDCDPTPTLRHHVNCAINNSTPGACDCVPVKDHDAGCPAMIGKVKASCGHPGVGIDGFNIVLRAAAVQAGVDGMDAYNDAATKAALLALFTVNLYPAS